MYRHHEMRITGNQNFLQLTCIYSIDFAMFPLLNFCRFPLFDIINSKCDIFITMFGKNLMYIYAKHAMYLACRRNETDMGLITYTSCKMPGNKRL